MSTSKHRGRRPPTYLIVLGVATLVAGLALMLSAVGGGASEVGVAPIAADTARPEPSTGEPTEVASPDAPGPATKPSAPSSLTVSEPSAAPKGTFAPDGPDADVPTAERAPEADPDRVEFTPDRITFGAGAAAGTAPVDTVGTLRSGSLELPEDPRRLGWWSGGSRAGAPYGSVVLAGHLDSREGLGFAARMTGLASGDEVSVSSGGLERRYRVQKTYLLPRTRLSELTALFSNRGDARLVLLTCGGSYDSAARAYSDNLVVEATPIG